jgi:RNA polymerase sigma-70 factor (ECF subfamily)
MEILQDRGVKKSGTARSETSSNRSDMPLVQQMPRSTARDAHEIAGLIERAREGDVAAFERLIADYQAKVFTFALAFTGDRERAKDLAQEALVKVYRSLGSFRFQSSFTTWLYSIVKNSYLDAVKSRAGREQSLESPLDDAEQRELVEASDAEQRMLGREARGLLLKALRQVPESFRVVVMMADIQELGYDEIARALDLPIGTVKSRLNRGRDALREVLFKSREVKP